MNTSALATLVAILDRGSFAAAAQQVGCTASAVSVQVKQLESHFGRPLFDRSTRMVRATPLALAVGQIARELLGRLDALRARRGAAIGGRVRLGAIASVQADTLPGALRWLKDEHSALEVSVSLNDSDALLADLKAARIDAAVLVRPASGGSSRLIWQELTRQPFVLLAPPDAGAGTPAELLRRHGWIRYDPALTGGRVAAQYVRRTAPRARCVMDLRAIDAIVAMVAAGLGVTVVPLPRKPLLDAYSVRTVALMRSAPSRQIAFVRRAADNGQRNLDAVRLAFTRIYGRHA